MRRAVLTVITIMIVGCTASSDRVVVFQRYVDAVNRKAVEEALSLHTVDAEFIIPGQRPVRGTDAIRSLLEWDAVLGTRLDFSGFEERGDTLFVASGAERNAWFDGVGLESIEYGAGLRVVFDGGLITGIYPSGLTPDSALELQAHVGAFMIWARAHAPDELERLLPEGYFQYDSQSAHGWIRLLSRYQDALSQAP